MVPLLGAIAGCHCSALWLQGAIVVCYGWTNFEGVDVVPLLCAVAGCHCSVLWLSGHGAMPLQGAIVVCYRCGGRGLEGPPL